MRNLVPLAMAVLCIIGCQFHRKPYSGATHSTQISHSYGPANNAIDRCAPSVGGPASPPSGIESLTTTVSEVDLDAIPGEWKSEVARALLNVELPKANRVFAVNDEVVKERSHRAIIFILYEDGPEAAHRIGTYRLDRLGNLYELDELADDETNMWIPVMNRLL